MRNKTSDALSRHPSGRLTPARLHLPDDSTATDVSCPRIPTNLLAGISIAPPTGVDDSEDDDSGLAIALSAAITDIPLNWEAIQVATAADGPLQELTLIIEDARRNQMRQGLLPIRGDTLMG